MKIILTLLAITSAAADRPSGAIDADWDISPADRSDYYPANHVTWTRFDDSSFVVRGKSRMSNRRVTRDLHAESSDPTQDSPRERRDVNPDANVDKFAGPKNYREARMNSPETWSKPSTGPQFRQRSSIDRQYEPDSFEENTDVDEVSNLPPLIRAHYNAPKADFVTSRRGGAYLDDRRGPYLEGRESRDMPVARSYDEYDTPVFRNVVREHDFDVQLPRNYHYPNRYRSQRDYYYRGPNSGPHPYDRYRDEEEEYEMYARYRPTPKPKRIIYYATLPEIVRKPVDFRNYQRPYDPSVRPPEAQIEAERNRVAPNSVEPSRRPLRYPYDNFDNYVKRSSYYDRRRPSFVPGEDERARDAERSRLSYKDKMRSDDRKLENRAGDDRRLPWPVQIGTEVSVKENERIPGRKIFGQMEGYDRYEGARMKKTSANAERKEDMHDENNTNSNNSDNNSNNN